MSLYQSYSITWSRNKQRTEKLLALEVKATFLWDRFSKRLQGV